MAVRVRVLRLLSRRVGMPTEEREMEVGAFVLPRRVISGMRFTGVVNMRRR
ncbi:MAG: hypothetical protein U1A77_14980 [Pirellulales bacterium]